MRQTVVWDALNRLQLLDQPRPGLIWSKNRLQMLATPPRVLMYSINRLQLLAMPPTSAHVVGKPATIAHYAANVSSCSRKTAYITALAQGESVEKGEMEQNVRVGWNGLSFSRRQFDTEKHLSQTGCMSRGYPLHIQPVSCIYVERRWQRRRRYKSDCSCNGH